MAQFEILERIGAGGFGEVYRARDTRLGRSVAVKVLPPSLAADAGRRERFRREAIAASALSHPNICTVHDLVEADGRFLIVMELVEGETLHAALARGPFPVARALPIAIQIADALGEAHRAGILPRDVKCGNVAVTPRGHVKVLDFGLAKLLAPPPEEANASALEKLTSEGTSPGTPGYMSPEQLLARPLDARSDLFSFGVVLYRMVTGQLPFEGRSVAALANAILNAEPRAFGDAPIPERLKAIVRKLLEKEPDRRYASAAEVKADLEALAESLAPGRKAGLSRGVRIALAAAAVLLLAAAGWFWHRWSRERWANEAKAEIARLVDGEEWGPASALLREARPILPEDPTLEKLWLKATGKASLETVPPGAEVSIRPYKGDPDAWQSLGRTPLREVRLPRGVYVWRLSKEGFAESSWIWGAGLKETVRLEPVDSVPAGMVPVPGEAEIRFRVPGLELLSDVSLDAFLIDRSEVTNEEYAKFVEAGGYRRSELWTEPFVRDGRTVPWDEAVASFLDTTGRPGPATWEYGRFPKGQEKHPVAGVSWYEAAAYAAFSGKSLPTIYHWFWASQAFGQTTFSAFIAPAGNFGGAGARPAASGTAASGFGTTDMAGNVKEWCRNETTAGARFILGGGFGEPTYMFYGQDAQPAWDRRPNYGLRCVKLSAPAPAALAGKVGVSVRDFGSHASVPDEVFEAYRGLYAYDKGDLDARVEETRTAEGWTLQKVTYRAAYGGERITARLFLPKGSSSPYQAVVFFPADNAIHSDEWSLNDSFIWEYVTRSGRALLYPSYKGTYERRDGLKSDVPEPTAFYRDHVVAWAKDLGRSLDYLETRDDVDRTSLAYLGASTGAHIAPVLLTVEDRFRAAVLFGGGFYHACSLPEVDTLNFVSRVRVPVLMLNGRHDFFFPADSSQAPMFRLLGTPATDKKHVLYETGHWPPKAERIRESLAWLDRYLGPVKR